MKGLKFKLNQDKKDQTNFGYDLIEIVGQKLHRSTTIHDTKYYEYMLQCITTWDGVKEFNEILEGELVDEIELGIYNLAG